MVVLGDGEVAEVPLDGGVCVEVFFDCLDVEESVNADVVDAPVVSRLVQTFHVEISEVCACDPEIRGNFLFCGFA